MVALKDFRLHSTDEGIPATALREISILLELKHPRIVNLKDIVHAEQKLFLIFEHMDFDLKKFIDS